MSLQKMVQKSLPYIKKAVDSLLIDILAKKNPDNDYSHTQGGGVEIWEEDADVQQFSDYYVGERKTKPKAKDSAEALAKQEERIANGTFGEKHITPDVQEELGEQIATNIQKYLPKKI